MNSRSQNQKKPDSNARVNNSAIHSDGGGLGNIILFRPIRLNSNLGLRGLALAALGLNLSLFAFANPVWASSCGKKDAAVLDAKRIAEKAQEQWRDERVDLGHGAQIPDEFKEIVKSVGTLTGEGEFKITPRGVERSYMGTTFPISKCHWLSVRHVVDPQMRDDNLNPAGVGQSKSAQIGARSEDPILGKKVLIGLNESDPNGRAFLKGVVIGAGTPGVQSLEYMVIRADRNLPNEIKPIRPAFLEWEQAKTTQFASIGYSADKVGSFSAPRVSGHLGCEIDFKAKSNGFWPTTCTVAPGNSGGPLLGYVRYKDGSSGWGVVGLVDHIGDGLRACNAEGDRIGDAKVIPLTQLINGASNATIAHQIRDHIKASPCQD